MSYSQKIKGKVLELIEKETTKDDEITAGDLFELGIFFAGMGRVFANNAKRMQEGIEKIAEVIGKA